VNGGDATNGGAPDGAFDANGALEGAVVVVLVGPAVFLVVSDKDAALVVPP
jgi:hypothetical protein